MEEGTGKPPADSTEDSSVPQEVMDLAVEGFPLGNTPAVSISLCNHCTTIHSLFGDTRPEPSAV